MNFAITLLDYIGIHAIVALGLVVLTGTAGQTSFAQAAFMGIGAYATALGTTRWGLSPWITLLLGTAVTAVSAWIIGMTTVRLRGHYLPLGTMAWAISLYHLFGTVPQLGGFGGISGIPPLQVSAGTGGLTWTFETPAAMLVPIGLTLALVTWGVAGILRSRPGRAMACLRARPAVLEACGVDPAPLRMRAFVLSALLACWAGWLYAHLQRFVNPTPFALAMGIDYLFMVVVGGAGHVLGALLGAAALTVLREALQNLLPAVTGQTGAIGQVVVGGLIVLLLQQRRANLWAWIEGWHRRTRAPSPARSPASDAPADAGNGRDDGRDDDRDVDRHDDRGDDDARCRAGTPSAGARRPVAGDDVPVLLRMDHVTRRFGGLVAIDDVGIDVRRGQITALIGPNGAGKSTLFNLVSGMDRADAGSIVFDGHDVTHLPAFGIARLGMARTFQHVRLVDAMSVLDNVAVGATRSGRAGFVRSALRGNVAEERAIVAQAGAQVARTGLQRWRHEPASSLPLGQQRIVEIARALCTRPTLLLLDEPAAGLRHHEKVRLARLLRDVRADGVTLLLVEHDMEFVMGLCDRIVVLQNGRRIADGPPAAIQRHPAVLDAYLGGAPDAPRSDAPRSDAPRSDDSVRDEPAVAPRISGQALTRTAPPGGRGPGSLPESGPASASGPSLEVEGLVVRHGRVRAVDGLTLSVGAGQIVTLIGANGAGKTSALSAMLGLLPSEGIVRFGGRDLAGLRTEARVSLGLALVPERRALFAPMTVEENLLLGAWPVRTAGGPAMRAALDEIYARFERLRERRHQAAGTLSGGERQMLAIGRALMSRPRVLLLDEPSLGLAPRIIEDTFRTIGELRDTGVGILLVEQNARAALRLADRAIVLENGTVVADGAAHDVARDERVAAAYLGSRQPPVATAP